MTSTHPSNIMNAPDKHVECVSDFCGNYKHPGAWADIYERENGSCYVALGGGWEFYGPKTPKTLEDSDPLFSPFLASCEADEDESYSIFP